MATTKTVKAGDGCKVRMPDGSVLQGDTVALVEVNTFVLRRLAFGDLVEADAASVPTATATATDKGSAS